MQQERQRAPSKSSHQGHRQQDLVYQISGVLVTFPEVRSGCNNTVFVVCSVATPVPAILQVSTVG